MKDKKFKKLIQKPLRFHHQDIHEELDDIKLRLVDIGRMVENVSSEMQRLQQRIEQSSV